jgi:hypothetical protein
MHGGCIGTSRLDRHRTSPHRAYRPPTPRKLTLTGKQARPTSGQATRPSGDWAAGASELLSPAETRVAPSTSMQTPMCGPVRTDTFERRADTGRTTKRHEAIRAAPSGAHCPRDLHDNERGKPLSLENITVSVGRCGQLRRSCTFTSDQRSARLGSRRPAHGDVGLQGTGLSRLRPS